MHDVHQLDHSEHYISKHLICSGTWQSNYLDVRQVEVRALDNSAVPDIHAGTLKLVPRILGYRYIYLMAVFITEKCQPKGVIQVLRNAVGDGGGVSFPGKKRYEGLRFNVISVTRGWVGVKFPGKKRYVTLEWPLS